MQTRRAAEKLEHETRAELVLADDCAVTVVPEAPRFAAFADWLKAPAGEFDFLTFEEADRLIAGAEDEWRAMIIVALRKGLRTASSSAFVGSTSTSTLDAWSFARPLPKE